MTRRQVPLGTTTEEEGNTRPGPSQLGWQAHGPERSTPAHVTVAMHPAEVVTAAHGPTRASLR